ncbi:hypothetical protein OSB04_009181 [Centaurea solstitialis]|uniref:Integrase catalytic domain-containing protein n=1 Tax=Centaurea solstitialis TaxID=347529 RepID=A0AA38WUA2_9ASTR|nr:hypothetical protein OSB04_009181 [Centaurea solstitialis]
MTSSPASSTLSSPTASQLVFALTNVYSQFRFKLSSDGSKYKLWHRIFLDMCKGAKVYGHITGKSKPASDNDEDWEAIDSRIKSWFYSTCDANLLQIISSDDCTAKDLWDKLDEFFLNNKMSRMLQLQEQFRNTKKGTSSITDFCHNLKNLADALADCDSKIDEIELVMQILRTQGHPQAYFGNSPGQVPPAQPGLLGAPPVQSFGAGAPQSFPAMFSAPPHPSPHTFLPPPVPSSPYLYGQHQSPHPVPVSSAYGQPLQQSTPVPPPPQPSFGGHASQFSQPQYTDLSSVFQAMSVQAPQDNNFYMDSGASRHMTFNQGTMHYLTPCNSNFIQVGNGDMVPARYIGHCTLPYSSYPLYLNNVLVSDKLIKNLISVRRFTIDNSVSVEFDPFGFTVKDLKTGSFLQRCDSDHHDLYPVLPPTPRSALASANVAVSFDVWHRRLGHPGAAIFQFLVSRKFIACSSRTSTLCHACQLGKHCRLPFSLSTTKTSRVFELIHSDLWTSPVTSLSGFKYYVLFLDDFSHFLWVFPLRAKSEVFSVFKTFRAYVLNQFKTDIQLFQCDNGREFNNQPFLDFFKTHDIKIRFSCPYTSPQNGKAERTIRTINNTLRTSLIQASLPPKFWVEALLSSVHTFNLLPSTTIQYKTPFEVLFGFSPTYSHLRVFGCLCYPNTSPTSAHKLAPRYSACVYLGPSTDHRGYRCLDLITQKVIISRHVNFDETHFPFPDFQPRPSSEDYDAFDVDDSLPSLSSIIDTSSPPSSAGSSASVSSSQPPPAEPSGISSSPSASSAEPSQPPAPATTSGHPMTTRSRTGSLKPKQIFNLSVTSDISPIPRSTSQAMCDPHWRAAMDAEMAAILSNYTWDLVPKPSDANIVGNRWLFRHKFDSNGRLERYKARLVAQGFSQQPGLDFDDTFSPVVKPATIRTVLSISISRNWPIHQLDVKNAFLHGDLTETVYMRQSPGYVNVSFPDHVCRLRKALYGLKQAPRAWYHRFAVYLSSLGFLSSKTDTSLFTYHRGSDTIYLILYVDDIILTASSPTLISMVISKLSSEFPMSDLGPLSFFLGIAASRSNHGLFLSQSAFAQEILARAYMVSCNPCSTPADTKTKLAVDGEPVSDPTLYRSLVGALQYLTFTRPDIAYAIQQVCLFMHDPRLPHLNALKGILRYLKGTLSHGLHIKASAVDRLVAYSDADWAGCPNTRRSTSGFCVYLGDNLVSWSSKRQHVVSRSSAEAEYRGIANVVAEAAWLRNLLLELSCPLSRATVVFCDNVSAMYLASNPVQHQRTKHVEIGLHFVRERVAIGHVRVLHVPSAYQYADIFTKGLPSSLFLDFRDSLNIRVPPDQTTGVCREIGKMNSNTFFLVISSFIFLYVLTTKLIRWKSGSIARLPPGPYPFPIIGNIFELGKNPHISLTSLSRTYGGLMSLKFGSTITVVVSSPEFAKEILLKHDLSFSSRWVPDTGRAANHHLFSVAWLPVGDQWRRLRKLSKEHLFSMQQLDAGQLLRREKIRELVDYVHECAMTRKPINIGGVAFTTAFNVLSNFIFSTDMARHDSLESQEFKDVVSSIAEVFGKPNLVDFFPLLKPFDPQGLLREATVYIEKLMAILDRIIEQRVQASAKSFARVASMNDVLDLLLDLSRKNESEFSRNDMLHLLLDLFAAATDTTTSTLEWAMAELVHNPEKMAKARSELKEVAGKDNTIIMESDIAGLPYLEAVVKETFRLHPPLPFLLPHKALSDVEIGGFVVPKDAQILCNVWAIGRDPTVWSNPHEFMPERFLDVDIDYSGQDFELIPFGSGRRICPGLPLAHRMLHLMLASLIQKFDWELEGKMRPEDMDMTERFGLTLHKNVPLIAIPINI